MRTKIALLITVATVAVFSLSFVSSKETASKAKPTRVQEGGFALEDRI